MSNHDRERVHVISCPHCQQPITVRSTLSIDPAPEFKHASDLRYEEEQTKRIIDALPPFARSNMKIFAINEISQQAKAQVKEVVSIELFNQIDDALRKKFQAQYTPAARARDKKGYWTLNLGRLY